MPGQDSPLVDQLRMQLLRGQPEPEGLAFGGGSVGWGAKEVGLREAVATALGGDDQAERPHARIGREQTPVVAAGSAGARVKRWRGGDQRSQAAVYRLDGGGGSEQEKVEALPPEVEDLRGQLTGERLAGSGAEQALAVGTAAGPDAAAVVEGGGVPDEAAHFDQLGQGAHAAGEPL